MNLEEYLINLFMATISFKITLTKLKVGNFYFTYLNETPSSQKQIIRSIYEVKIRIFLVITESYNP